MVQSQSDSDIAAEIIRTFEQLAGRRGTWEGHWEEIARRIYTDNSQYFNNRQMNITKGDRRTEELYDSTAATALNRFSAILDSLLTPRNQTWHRILSSDPELNKDRSVRLWFEEVNRLLFKFRYAPKANFASQNQLNFKSLGAFGTGSLSAKPSPLTSRIMISCRAIFSLQVLPRVKWNESGGPNGGI